MPKQGNLASGISAVVSSGNCSACGGCALISQSASLALSKRDWLRPSNSETSEPAPEELRQFHEVCPGYEQKVSRKDFQHWDQVFGGYYSVWEGYATDNKLRFEASSAGVLTALQKMLLSSDDYQAKGVVSLGSADSNDGSRTGRWTDSVDELDKSVGSYYAPSSVTAALPRDGSDYVFVGRPCEIKALASAARISALNIQPPTLTLSFFCAGVPSQSATDDLLETLKPEPDSEVKLVRYRGRGWPGNFTAKLADDSEVSVTYENSWGKHLGRNLDEACKTCPDGTGQFSDVSVGDYWLADDTGFPIFQDREGNSVIIARTRRGHDALLAAHQSGLLEIKPLDISKLWGIQPLQTSRRLLLLGRMMGKRIAGRRVRRLKGYGLVRGALKSPLGNIRAMLGGVRRALIMRASK